jgi:hypothetical protein
MNEITQITELLMKLVGYSGTVGVIFVIGYFVLKVTPYLSAYAVIRYFLSRHYNTRDLEAKGFKAWADHVMKDTKE